MLALTILLLTASTAKAQFVAGTLAAQHHGVVITPGWTFIQETGPLLNISGCAAGGSTCSFTVAATTSGSAWVMFIGTGNTGAGVHINSVTGGSGSWLHCAACAIVNATGGSSDAYYNVSGSAGTTSFTITLSGNATSFYIADFVEVLPPAGFTPSFDVGGATATASCTTCTAVSLTTTATDAIIQWNDNGGSTQGWNSFSSPWITNANNANGLYLNALAGSIAAPTFVQTSGFSVFSAIAFKSSAGSFSVPAALYSLVAVTAKSAGGNYSCSPTCNITVPSTGTGNLLFIWSAETNNHHISSISGGGTWVIPTGANTCTNTISSLDVVDCAYVLSSSSGVTTISVTYGANATPGIIIYEVSRTSGSFVLDAQNSTQWAANSANNTGGLTTGQALTLGGSNDAIFQANFIAGGIGFSTLYPQTHVDSETGSGAFLASQAAGVVLLNTTNGNAQTWLSNQTNQVNSVEAIAFK